MALCVDQIEIANQSDRMLKCSLMEVLFRDTYQVAFSVPKMNQNFHQDQGSISLSRLVNENEDTA